MSGEMRGVGIRRSDGSTCDSSLTQGTPFNVRLLHPCAKPFSLFGQLEPGKNVPQVEECSADCCECDVMYNKQDCCVCTTNRTAVVQQTGLLCVYTDCNISCWLRWVQLLVCVLYWCTGCFFVFGVSFWDVVASAPLVCLRDVPGALRVTPQWGTADWN